MEKIANMFLTFFAMLTMASCTNTPTYSLKEAGGFEISNISSISASTSVYQSLCWPIEKESYSYLDCKYIKVDFDIQKEYLSSWPPSELQDDAYVLHAEISDSDTYANTGLVFFISHNSNYLYFDGLEGTYRSQEKMSSKFIDMIQKDKKKDGFKIRVIDEDHQIYDNPFQTEDYLTPGTQITLHSYPIMDADLVMYVNGEFYSKQKDVEMDGQYVWEYRFTMIEKDVTLRFSIEGGW